MPTKDSNVRDPWTPYCNNCGYDLSNLTESSKCPECGRPLVEVLTRGPHLLQSGKRFRSKATLFGLPVIDIALGPKGGEPRGRATGIIAIGDIATGGIAIGGVARGVVAFGGLAVGGFTLGGASIGLFTALGGGAIGGIAVGGGALGGIAQGGGALGFVAQGGGAVGYFARGGSALGVHTISMQPPRSDPAAVRAFEHLSSITGTWPPPNQLALLSQMAVPLVLTLAAAATIALVAMVAMRREPET
jgi:hypothetical protein